MDNSWLKRLIWTLLNETETTTSRQLVKFRTWVLFVGLLILYPYFGLLVMSVLWFQCDGRSLAHILRHLHAMDSLDSPLVPHLPTFSPISQPSLFDAHKFANVCIPCLRFTDLLAGFRFTNRLFRLPGDTINKDWYYAIWRWFGEPQNNVV